MSEEKAMATAPQGAMAKAPQKVGLREYIRSDEIQLRFADIVGRQNVGSYISSVMIAVANSDQLQQCEMKSIVSSALRAATLKLEVDPGIGYAYLVPYGKQANLIIGYKGLHQLAVRTGKYRAINVFEIWEGETPVEDRFTGFYTIAGSPKNKEKAIGVMAYFELLKGYKKYLYMTMEEIEAHAKLFSKSYGSDSKNNIWKTNRRSMEKKTVLRLLLTRWADLSGIAIADIDGDSDFAADLPEPAEAEPKKPMTKKDVDKSIRDMGFDTGPVVDGEFEEETLPDPEEVTPEKEPEPTPPPAAPEDPTKRPFAPEYLRTRIVNGAKKYKEENATMTAIERNTVMVGMTNLFVGIDGAQAHGKKVLKFLTGTDDQTALEDYWFVALRTWLGLQMIDGEPTPSGHACDEGMEIIEFMNNP